MDTLIVDKYQRDISNFISNFIDKHGAEHATSYISVLTAQLLYDAQNNGLDISLFLNALEIE